MTRLSATPPKRREHPLRRQRRLLEMLERYNGLPLTSEDFIDELGLTKRRCDQLAVELVSQGLVTRSGTDYKGSPFQYQRAGGQHK